MDGQDNQQQQDSAAITLIDLQNVIQVLDIASTRGAFRGPELEPVGQLFNKIKRFVDNAVAQQQASAPQEGNENG